MQSIASFPSDIRSTLKGVFSDIDDTLTNDGSLTAAAYTAMERLQQAGLLMIPITGRPAGWCDHIARMWPVDGVVGENGAFYFRYDRSQKKMIRRFLQSDEERARGRQKLAALREQILAAVPGTGIASDQSYREADLAIDFCEDVPALPQDDIDRIVNLFRAAGAAARVSSIHVNGWFGNYDKLTMTKIMMAECFGVDLDTGKEHFTFVGDSPNDAPMFAHFPHAVGVANVADFEGRMDATPAYITEGRGGTGFAEFANIILK